MYNISINKYSLIEHYTFLFNLRTKISDVNFSNIILNSMNKHEFDDKHLKYIYKLIKIYKNIEPINLIKRYKYICLLELCKDFLIKC